MGDLKLFKRRSGSMKRSVILTIGAALLSMAIIGCESENQPLGVGSEELSQPMAARSAALKIDDFPVPAGLKTVAFGPSSFEIWPYTGSNFSGAPQDPINLIFVGQADPLDIRAALLSLDGDRSAFGMPPVSPFNAVWDDAIGDVQTAYASSCGWTGSAIQLECGDHKELRFHMRLFKAGDVTIANAHFEVLIPGTTTHQVLNWEMAEQFVIADFIRSGLLDPVTPMVPAPDLNDSPFREIPDMIYNELPVELRGLIGGPLTNVSAAVPIGTDGNAMILNLAGSVARVSESRNQTFTIDFAQAVPKPFCADGPYDFMYVSGPVYLTQTSTLSDDGVYETHFSAEAQLAAQPINPLTGQPTGEALSAGITEKHDSYYSSHKFSASSFKHQMLLPTAVDGSGQFFETMRVSSNGKNGFESETRCGAGSSQSVADAGSQGRNSTSAGLLVDLK
jgi:hypothetical protein